MDFQPKISEVMLSNDLKKSQSPRMHTKYIENHVGRTFPSVIIQPTQCQEVTTGWIGCPLFLKKKKKHQHLFSLCIYVRICRSISILISACNYILCLNSSELCTRLPALTPPCICFSALISMHADGKLNYEKPQSLIPSRCGCQRKVKIQIKMVLGNLNLPLQESPLIILGEDWGQDIS